MKRIYTPLDMISEFESFFKRYKDKYIYYFREFPFVRSLHSLLELNADSVAYYKTHPEAKKQKARSEEEIEKLIRVDAEESFKEIKRSLQRHKPPSKIWREDNGYGIELYTYDLLDHVLRWQVRILTDGTIIKYSVKGKSGIQSFGPFL